MAKSIRSKIKRKHRAVQREIHYPVVVQNEVKRMVRAKAYITEQTTKKLLTEGKLSADQISEEDKKAIIYAEQLHHVDEQKRVLREKGNFFFVHPHAKENVFPIVETPEDLSIHTGKDSVNELRPAEDLNDEKHDRTGSSRRIERREYLKMAREMDKRLQKKFKGNKGRR